MLFVLSWLPLAQFVIWSTGTTDEHAGRVRIVVWTLQSLVGFLGVALAGSATFKLARQLGWRRVPPALWVMFRTGRSVAPDDDAT
jgi:hypothetical protein